MVEDKVNVRHGCRHRRVVAQIGLDEIHLPGHMREVIPLSRPEIVEHAHGVAILHQPAAQVRTDEARSSGYQIVRQIATPVVELAAASDRNITPRGWSTNLPASWRIRILWFARNLNVMTPD